MDYGKQRLTDLLKNPATAQPIAHNDTDIGAIRSLQDLLRSHGYKTVPSLQSVNYGKLNTATLDAIKNFNSKHNGGANNTTVNTKTLTELISLTPITPICSLAYLDFKLLLPINSWEQLLSLVAIVEGAGKFAALNLNTDRAGLSYGILQWAQKPKRLLEIVNGMHASEKQKTETIFGGAAKVAGLIAHLSKARGGVKTDGTTTDSLYDLIVDPWKECFQRASHDEDLQKVQIKIAIGDFKAYRSSFLPYATKIKTEREVAFMLDLINQHGATGAKNIYTTADSNTLTGLALLKALRHESVETVKRNHPNNPEIHQATNTRRTFFLDTKLLEDTNFVP